MESEIYFGTTRIVYGVERSARRHKTVAVAVEADGRVRVRAPLAASDEKIAAVVHGKARWILERQRRQEVLPPARGERHLVSGETFLYLGRQYRLKVCPRGTGDGDVHLRGRWFEVSVPGAAAGESREALVRELLIGWYRERAKRWLPERVAAWWPVVGVEPSEVWIREPLKRWASCDARGNLRFNWRIVQAPRRLVDYVVVHELVHLSHPDHGHDFWAALGGAMPDYEERREALRQLGRRLVW